MELFHPNGYDNELFNKIYQILTKKMNFSQLPMQVQFMIFKMFLLLSTDLNLLQEL